MSEKTIQYWIDISEYDLQVAKSLLDKDHCLYESFELLLKFGKSSFPRKQESSPFKNFWIPAYAGMTK